MWSLSHYQGEDSGFEQLDLWVPLRGQLWMAHAIVFPSVFVQAVWVAVDLQEEWILNKWFVGKEQKKENQKKNGRNASCAKKKDRTNPPHYNSQL